MITASSKYLAEAKSLRVRDLKMPSTLPSSASRPILEPMGATRVPERRYWLVTPNDPLSMLTFAATTFFILGWGQPASTLMAEDVCSFTARMVQRQGYLNQHAKGVSPHSHRESLEPSRVQHDELNPS
ncbi:hypothetical protein BDN71DRAFT_1513741 [Pleurotus eryngii]|uniref:Uncharacterized protein n=1 Tax=Pleurotus eryngii TaxID=5323 RepID=A0A9P5ZGL1_PLEER|nr:hypothetical protein BDN71DRAFT_1513741 [Pleurotus eryngii]